MIAIDTNLLVYALHPGAPEHGRARRALERAQQSGAWGIAAASALEFWSVATRTRGGRAIATCAEAAGFLESLRRAGAKLWDAEAGQSAVVLVLATELAIAGPRIFDLAIAVAALRNGATELWTHDLRFAAPPELRVVDPMEA